MLHVKQTAFSTEQFILSNHGLLWLALLETLPFGARWLCTARAASGSADAVSGPAPAIHFPFPGFSWHYWSLVDQDPVSNSLQCRSVLSSQYFSLPISSSSDLCGLMDVVFCYLSLPFPALHSSALCFGLRLRASLSSFPPNF